MEFTQLVELTSIIVPVGTMVGTLIPILNSVSKSKRAMQEGIDRLNKSMLLANRDIARLTLHDEHLPIEERINAGRRYRDDYGGNGASAIYCNALEEQYKAGMAEIDSLRAKITGRDKNETKV